MIWPNRNISSEKPGEFERFKAEFLKWNASTERSIEGLDYPERKVKNENPERHFWTEDDRYESFKEEHGGRPEYSGFIKGRLKSTNK